MDRTEISLDDSKVSPKVKRKQDSHEIDSKRHYGEKIYQENSLENYSQNSAIDNDTKIISEIIDEKVYYPSYMGCRSVTEFETMNWIEEGMYGVVFRGRDRRTHETVALKKLKMEREREGFPITSLREINCLLKLRHENVVHVKEVVVGEDMDKIFIVMEYVEHDLKTLLEAMRRPFSVDQMKTLVVQLLRGVAHLHDNWVIHRDIKTSNLLLNHRGILKIADFGLAREYGSPLLSYTPVVVTLWYRSPELLLGIKEYFSPIDIWSVGCVFAELILTKALFPGKSEGDQIKKIFCELGTPNDKIWPGPPAFSELPFAKNINFQTFTQNNLKSRFGKRLTKLGLDLMNSFFTYDPLKRITAQKALEHPFFSESPLPLPPSLFPTWPTKHEREAKKRKENASPKAPQGGNNFDSMADDEELFNNHLTAGANTMGFTMSSTGRGFITSLPNSVVKH